MKMKTTLESKKGVSRQTLYMAVLISLTVGFVSGAAYTSFKLAQDASTAPVHTHAGAKMGGPAPSTGPAAPDVDARIAELETVVAQNPENATAWSELGHLFFDTNRAEEAIQAYQKSLAIEPDNPAVLTDMGVMYRRSGDPEKAVAAFDQAVSVSPGFETALFNKGVVLMADLNDLAGARAAWEALVKVNPDATTPNGEKVADIVARMAQQN
jgi:cytochrome c-type biogenesis protein CcmH/NrfG